MIHSKDLSDIKKPVDKALESEKTRSWGKVACLYVYWVVLFVFDGISINNCGVCGGGDISGHCRSRGCKVFFF